MKRKKRTEKGAYTKPVNNIEYLMLCHDEQSVPHNMVRYSLKHNNHNHNKQLIIIAHFNEKHTTKVFVFSIRLDNDVHAMSIKCLLVMAFNRFFWQKIYCCVFRFVLFHHFVFFFFCCCKLIQFKNVMRHIIICFLVAQIRL